MKATLRKHLVENNPAMEKTINKILILNVCLTIFWIPRVKGLINLSVIWQKGESQNGGNKNRKHAKFSEKRTFFTP